MATFRYKYGDRPLEGYTIEHGVGRGGFGEVYYAISDSGRQVALKAVQNYEEIELRGISHCMNLKSPHLVTVFDVKFNDRREPFVIMEYVAGPSLRQLLDASPQGLGQDKAAFFLREIGKGLNFLHDCGVVHRDLKPHNVFYEDGVVKIGDYSLSKAITSSHRSGHTITVGTVHYMAPEISLGRYGASVDIYALGIMLYEMLTGTPPFTGQSMGEVLMKHMTAEPDLSGIDEPFASTIRRALAKQPEDRFATAMDMVQSVFGSQQIQQSMSSFNPASLTIIAKRASQQVAQRRDRPAARDDSGNLDETQSVIEATPVEPKRQPARGKHRCQMTEKSLAFLSGRGVNKVIHGMGMGFGRWMNDANLASEDPMDHRQRMNLALATSLAMTVVLMVIMGSAIHGPIEGLVFVWWIFAVIVAQGSSILWARHQLIPHLDRESPWVGRIAFAGVSLVATATITLLIWPFLGRDLERAISPTTLLASVIPVLFLDWREHTSSGRAHRLTLGPVVGAAVIALIAGSMLDGSPPLAAGVAAAVALAVQLGSPWRPRVPQTARPAAPVTGNSPSPSNAQGDVPIHPIATPVYSQAASSSRSKGTKQPGEVSPKSRLVALLLNVIPGTMGICGIHRIYSGQFISGLLWLVTLGLLGIGQLIDLVLIAMGEYNDSRGRPILRWSSQRREAARRAAPEAWTTVYPAVGRGRVWFDRLLALVGALILTAALAVGFLVAINVPAMLDSGVNAGIYDGPFQMALQVERNLGPKWTELFLRIGSIVATVLASVGGGLLLISRRGSSVMHVARVVLAGASFLVALITISNTIGTRYSWENIMGLVGRGEGSEAFLRFTDGEALIVLAFTAISGIAGVLLLAWPERRWRTEPAPAASYAGAVGQQTDRPDVNPLTAEQVVATSGEEI